MERIFIGGIDYVVLSPAPGVMRLRIATASPVLTNASYVWDEAATAFRESWEQHPNVILVLKFTIHGSADRETVIEVRRHGVATVELQTTEGRHHDSRMMIAIPFPCFMRDAYHRCRKLSLLIAD